MPDSLSIGPAPYLEQCVQVGTPDYAARARRECLAFIHAIRKKLGNEPEGARLSVQGFQHDFGTYYEVVCHFDEGLPAAVEYAVKCESDAPSSWVEVNMRPPASAPSANRGR